MTPTADDRGGSLFRTRREAGFLFRNGERYRSSPIDGTDVVSLNRPPQSKGTDK
jgi:hypothetical protein